MKALPDATIAELQAWPLEAHKVSATRGLICKTPALLGLTRKKVSAGRAGPLRYRRGAPAMARGATEPGPSQADLYRRSLDQGEYDSTHGPSALRAAFGERGAAWALEGLDLYCWSASGCPRRPQCVRRNPSMARPFPPTSSRCWFRRSGSVRWASPGARLRSLSACRRPSRCASAARPGSPRDCRSTPR